MSVFGGFSSYSGKCHAEDPPPIYLSVNIGEARRDHPYIHIPPPRLPALVARGEGPFWQKIPGWRDAHLLEVDNEPYVSPLYFRSLGLPYIPPSILRDSHIIDVPHPLTRKRPTPRIRNDKTIEMGRNDIYYTLAPRSYPDHENMHDLFIRALSNEELEYLVGHYYDMWMWETGSADHKETFEALLYERDLRKSKGWVVRRPTLNDVKTMEKDFGRAAFRKHEKLHITLPKPGPKPYPRRHGQSIITDALGRRKMSRCFMEWLDGYLRRMPKDL